MVPEFLNMHFKNGGHLLHDFFRNWFNRTHIKIVYILRIPHPFPIGILLISFFYLA